MKPSSTAVLVCLLLCHSLPQAKATIEFAYTIKGKLYLQTDNAAPVGPLEWSFGAGVSGDNQVTAASFTHPGAAEPIAIDGVAGSFDLDVDPFATQEAMDAAYPNGTFSMTVTDGGNETVLGPFTISGNAYPAAPHMTNVENLLSHDFTQTFELTWNAFAGAEEGDQILLQIWDNNLDEDIVFEFLPSSAVSYTLPANAFSVDNYYEINLIFVNETDGLESPETIFGYIASTEYLLSTQTSDTALNFAKWQRNTQTGPEEIHEDGYRPWAIVSGNSRTVTYAEVNSPATSQALGNAAPNIFVLNAPFSSKASLDASYPSGEYWFFLNEDGESVSYGPFFLAEDAYPAPPVFQNFSELQTFDASQPQAISWSAPPLDVSQVLVFALNGSGATVWSESLLPSVTSVEIPANTLAQDAIYTLVVRFSAPQVTSDRPPASLGYLTSTRMTAQTSANGGGGGPAIELIFNIKERIYQQEGNTPPTTPSEWAFGAGAFGGSGLQSGSVEYPGGVKVLDSSGGGLDFEESFGSQAALDTAYPNGSYTVNLTVDGEAQSFGPFDVSGDSYPAPPHLMNVLELEGHDLGQDFQLNWSAFSEATATDSLVFQIADLTGDSEDILEFLPPTTTSYLIPGGTLSSNKEYEIRVLFIKETGGLESPETIVGYLSETSYGLSTWPSDFTAWLALYFSESDLLDPAIAGENADPDGDGFNNRFEFLARLDPSDRHDRLYFDFGPDNLRIYPVKGGIDWHLRNTGDLQNWTILEPASYERFGEEVQVDLRDFPAPIFIQFVLEDEAP